MNYYLTQTAICFHLTIHQLQSSKRDRVLVDARTAYAAICRGRTKMTLEQVAATLNKSYSTVIHYMKNLRTLPDVRLKYEALCKFIDYPPSDLIAHIDKRKEQRKKLAELFAQMK